MGSGCKLVGPGAGANRGVIPATGANPTDQAAVVAANAAREAANDAKAKAREEELNAKKKSE